MAGSWSSISRGSEEIGDRMIGPTIEKRDS